MKKSDKTELEKKLEQEMANSTDQQEAEVQKEEVIKDSQQNDEQSADDVIDIAAIVAERDEAKDQLLRTLAEFDNYRKRLARENERTRKLAAESIVRDMLPVLDNLERALEHAGPDPGPLGEGVRMVVNQFREVLERNGLKQIPALNEPFDPNVHEAMMQVESEVPADHVVQEFQKGYKLGDFVVRPAKVIVSKGMPQAESPDMQPTEAGGAETQQK